MDVLSIDKGQEKREKEVKQAQCKMCKGFFPSDLIAHSKCPECTCIFNEWKNGRKKTPEEQEKFKGIRAHYKIPAYKRVYSVYQYDQQKYSDIWKKIQELAIKYGEHIYKNTSPYRVLELCYIKNKEGKLEHLKDEKHIFRYSALHKICALVAKTLTEKHGLLMDETTTEYLKRKTGIIYYNDDTEPMAEYEKAQRMPLKERIIVAIRLYRLLNIDEFTIEKASSLAPQIDVKFSKKTGKLLNPENITQNTKAEGEIEKPFKDWERIKELYINGYEVKKLAQRFSIPVTTLREKIVKENWGKIQAVENFIERENQKCDNNITALKINEINETPKGDSMDEEKEHINETSTQPEDLERIKWHNAVKEDIVNGLQRCEIMKKYNISDTTYYRLKNELEEESILKPVTILLTSEEEKEVRQFIKTIRRKEYTFKLNEEEHLLVEKVLNFHKLKGLMDCVNL